MAEDQVALEVGELVGGDAGLREEAEAGVDAVDGLAPGNDAIDRSGGGVDRGERCVGQARGGAGPEQAQRVEGDGAGGEGQHMQLPVVIPAKAGIPLLTRPRKKEEAGSPHARG